MDNTTRIYYDADASLDVLQGRTVGVIGYGIQGRAHALTLRDAGLPVLVANRSDRYAARAAQDGFSLEPIEMAVERSDVLLLLIPDQAQAAVYERSVRPRLRPGCLLLFAHGYALRFGTLALPAGVDGGMLAPRMPGEQIRQAYMAGGGVSAFADIVQDATGTAWPRLLAVAKAMGFTRAGVLQVSCAVEAELDLFIEQYLVATLVQTMSTAFDVLVAEHGYPAVPALMELCASGELAEVLRMGARLGFGHVFQQHASPTCQFGIADRWNDKARAAARERALVVLEDITNGAFVRRLEQEGVQGYPRVRAFWDAVNHQSLEAAQAWINASVRRPDT